MKKRGRQARAGFNSATAVMPWRPLRILQERDEWKRLQFGHGGDAVETRSDRNLFSLPGFLPLSRAVRSVHEIISAPALKANTKSSFRKQLAARERFRAASIHLNAELSKTLR